MPRTRRQWSTIRSEARKLLRETVADDSFWGDAELLFYANIALDLRAQQLMEVDEGWFTDRALTDLVANQKEYTLEEGVDGIKRILVQYSPSSNPVEIPLIRNERLTQPMATATSVGGPAGVPTCRLVGELIYLEPPPTESRTNGLIVEYEALPDRLTGDASKVDLKWPSTIEGLLVLDVWDIALGVEDAQGNVNPEVRGRLQKFHEKYEKIFLENAARRLDSPNYSTPFFLGD